MSTTSNPARRTDVVVIAYLAFMGMMMATGIDISLPAFDEIDADLGADGRESLIVTLYFMGAAFGQLVIGPLSDMIGRRPVILGGLALYLIGAAACALAPNYGFLLGARFVWGLGAAAPTGVRTAISRDLYSGDAMARVTTIMMAVFLVGPVFTPLIGQGLLGFGDWPIVFWFCVVLGALAVAATVWFGETLPPERRRPADFAKFIEALGVIGRTRTTLGYLASNVFWSAAFFIFLGSAQPVFDRIYGREEQFAVYFAALGVWTIPLLLGNNQLIKRIGATRASIASALVSVTACIVGLVVVGVVDAPGFWFWYVWLAFASSFITLTTPPMYALALEPMGDLAGTVSALLYFSGFALGSGLAALVDARIDTSITPFIVGFAIYAFLAFACQMWAARGEAAPQVAAP